MQTITKKSRFAAGDLQVSDLQVGDVIHLWNPYGGPCHHGAALRYRINRTHYDLEARAEGKFVSVAAEQGVSDAGTVFLHFIAYRVNQQTGSSFGSEKWQCIHRDRITAIYRNGAAL